MASSGELTPRHLKEAYERGENLSALLRNAEGISLNTERIVELSYDLQAGSYSEAMQDRDYAATKRDYVDKAAAAILSLMQPASILEAGVGEATTLSGVLQRLGTTTAGYGFDLSWSRIAYAKQWLGRENVSASLCTGSLFHLPYATDAFDVVYTSHSIEPNGGNELPVLRELYRVTREYLVLLEPGYELAPPEAKARMESHGYCRDLAKHARDLGYDVLRHELFGVSENPLNPTAITIIHKPDAGARPDQILACPRFKTPLVEFPDVLYSPEALAAYPIVGGIPCLLPSNAIFASRFMDLAPASYNGRP